MKYKVGTLFNQNKKLDPIYIKRIEEVNEINYIISYPFDSNFKNKRFTYSKHKIKQLHILTKKEIKQLNKILTFQ